MAVERAVVTGGAGFVGSSVVEALVGRGTSVLVVDDLSTGSAANLDRITGDVELFKHDIRDGAPLRAGALVARGGRIAVVPSPLRQITAARVYQLDGSTLAIDLQAFVSDKAAVPSIVPECVRRVTCPSR